jgi:hypothetical protein
VLAVLLLGGLAASTACTAAAIDPDPIEPRHSDDDDDEIVEKKKTTTEKPAATSSTPDASARTPPATCVACGDAGAGCVNGTCSVELRIRAFVDGHSELVLSGTTAHWHQVKDAVPGRWEGHNEPTFLNGAPWTPSWPSDGENRNCNCDSGPSPRLPEPAAIAQTVTVKRLGDRGNVTITQQPSAANGFALKVDFDDSSSGAAWHEVLVSYRSK